MGASAEASCAIHVGPHVYSFGGTQSVIRTIRDCSIGADSVRALATWNGPGHVKNARLLVRAARVLARSDPRTIVHFHISNGGAWIREGLLIRLARARSMRVVISLHGFEFPEFATKHPRFVRSTLSKANHVICLSDEAQSSLAKLGLTAVSVLANPVAIDRDSPPADTVAPVALFAGTIGIRKGVDVLVDAWAQLLNEGIVGECRIVGELDDYTPPSLDRMSVEPAVHPSEIAALLRTVRVVVLPSRAEAMPMILTEALAAARPFIATPVGGTREITPDGDMMVPVGDAAALAAAIARYLNDGELARQAGKRGQDYIIETRSPEVIDARLRAIYAGL